MIARSFSCLPFSTLVGILMKRFLQCTVLVLVIIPASPILSSGSGIYGGLNLGDFLLDAPRQFALDQLRSTKNIKPSYAVGAYINVTLLSWSFPDKTYTTSKKKESNQKELYVNISAQTEIFYTNKGALYILRNPFNQIRSRFNFEYVEFPLLFKLELGLTSLSLNFYINGGVSLSILQRANRADTGVANQQEIIIDLKNQYNTLDINTLLGAGVSFEFISGYEILIEGRYSFGLLNKEIDPTDSFLFHRNIYILFGTGIRI